MGWLDNFRSGPNEKQFAQSIIDRLKAAGDTREIVHDPSNFQLVFRNEGQDQGVLNLANLYAEYQQVDESDHEQCLSNIVRAALSHLKEIPSEYSEASFDIRPRLWTRSTLEQIQLRNLIEGGEEQDWPSEAMGEHFVLSLVYDFPESVRSITQADLDRWGVTYWEAREKAVENLRQTEFSYTSVGDQLYSLNTNDSYDATRILLTELPASLNIEGTPIAMIPNRETLLLTGSESDVGQKMMLEFSAMQIRDQPRPMSGLPLRLSADQQWEDWFPDTDHPLWGMYNQLKILTATSEYRRQTELLGQWFEMSGRGEFIADYDTADLGDGISSFCVWTNGVPSLLPETEWIVFFDPDLSESKPLYCRADAVYQQLSQMIVREKYYPTRFRVDEFPTAEQLSKLPVQEVPQTPAER